MKEDDPNYEGGDDPNYDNDVPSYDYDENGDYKSSDDVLNEYEESSKKFVEITLLRKVKTLMSMMLMMDTPKTLNLTTTVMTTTKRKPSKVVSHPVQKMVNGAGKWENSGQ